MTLVSGTDKVISLHVVNRYGFEWQYGAAHFGHSLFGLYNPWSGIYSVKHTRKGPRVSRMVHYWPTNPQTPSQMARRAIFATGKGVWDTLTSDMKLAYNKRAKRYRMSGFNLFMREYLHTH